MRNLIYKVLNIFCITVLLLVTIMCTDNYTIEHTENTNIPEGYVHLSVMVELSPFTQVKSRSVDPDSKGIESMRLYCFDKNGLFVTTVSTELKLEADTETGYYLSGVFNADIPEYVNCVHLVANQNTDAFRESDYLGKSEKTVMTGLIASSSNMVYWGRVEAGMNVEGTPEAPEGETLKQTFERIMKRDAPNNKVHLVRNQARIQFYNIEAGNSDSNSYFNLDGFYVCNTNAFGTIAPFNENTNKFDWVTNANDRNYITLPPNNAKSTDPDEVDTSPAQYVFETENSVNDPVSVIVKGSNKKNGNIEESKYYRIFIQDENFNTYLIKRNHSYNINIEGNLTPGYNSFNEALNGTPVNNVYFTIDDEINSITTVDGYNLTVQFTDTVIVRTDNDNIREFNFEYNYSSSGTQVSEDDVEIQWTGEQDVAEQIFSHNKVITDNKINGSVSVNLLPMGDYSERRGSLLIKAGKLIRTVKIITVKKQNFIPTWVSSMVWNGAAGENFTLMFTIPESCPSELFPFDVMVSAPDMDVRSATGMRLDVITKLTDPVKYGEDVAYMNNENEYIGYKYVYPVTGPGTQRIYFRTTFSNQEEDRVTIENPYFETMQRPYYFSSENVSIALVDMKEGSVDDLPGNTGTGSEKVYYYIVPRKINAPVNFKFSVKDYSTGDTGTSLQLNNKDEFFLMSSNLIHDNNKPVDECFIFLDNVLEGNVFGKSWGFYVGNNPPQHDVHTVNMYTNTPNSAEVVRISSNTYGKSMKDNFISDYEGHMYRSATFELANYRAFDFNTGISANEITDPLQKEQEWTYELGQEVNVSFDVTSFIADTDDRESVDPFGTSFKVFIDAPMLEIDWERVNEMGIPTDKFFKDADGRFVYIVDEDREQERALSSNYSVVTVEQNNNYYKERKVLPFKTSKIVSAGNVTISSDNDIVDYNTETFTVKNKSITGSIKYSSDGNNVQNVPDMAFVSFERTRDNTRIGTVTVKDGRYELRLKGEYNYDWSGTEYIVFKYIDGSQEYSTAYNRMTLADLFNNTDVVLNLDLSD